MKKINLRIINNMEDQKKYQEDKDKRNKKEAEVVKSEVKGQDKKLRKKNKDKNQN